MKTLNIRRTAGIAALALAVSTSLAACGGAASDTAADAAAQQTQSGDSQMPQDQMASEKEGMSENIAAQTIGTACSAIPDSGAGSLKGMATEPVATAASANPLLDTLVTAVKKAGLVDTLNSAESITVFAPTDKAFDKIPQDKLNALLANQKKLTTVLTHHVVGMQLSPQELAGTHKTLAGDTITVSGSVGSFTVGNENAKILCGNIPTANATVYVIDTVLMP